MSFLAVALAIPWVFWGALIALAIASGRSWVGLLIIPIGITVVLLIAANLTSAREVFWASLILHLFFLVSLGGSFAGFMLKERKNRK